MSITKTRKKNSRFYWAELGFLALGLVGLNPTLLTDLLIGATTPVPQSPPAQPFYGYPTSSPAYSPYGAFQPSAYAPNGWNGVNQTNPPSAYFQQTGYGASQPTASTFSQPEIQLLASRVSEYLSNTASQWWNSQPGAQGSSQDLRPSTAGLAPGYAPNYPSYQQNNPSGGMLPYGGAGQFGASTGYGAAGYGNAWQNQLPSTGTPATVPPPSYNVQGSVPFPSTTGATYSAQLPSGASAYANPSAMNYQTTQQPNLVRGYPSNYQTLANPGSFVPAGSTANVMQQRQTQTSLPTTSPSSQNNQNGWASPYPAYNNVSTTPSPATGVPPVGAPTNGYYGRY
ncbi:hypothetical protein SH501x_000262 [Pirellulaceae bacterium SH501]